MLMSPNKDETAVHGCHCLGDMAVRMRKVLAIPRKPRSYRELKPATHLAILFADRREFIASENRNDDGNGNENVSWKSNFALLLLLRDYSNSFNLYNVGVVSRN